MKPLTQDAVRGLLIAAQGLEQHPDKPATKRDVRRIIRQMHILQIDTISVVARSPYFVLWSRLGSYDPRWLEELLAEGALFEYWSHAASFLPVEDYPLYRRSMLDRRTWNESSWSEWMTKHGELVERMLTHIRENGAVRSSDFERTDGQASGWWNWKEEKVVLEGLFLRGDVMVAKRHNFQRLYDLRERVVKDWDDARAPSIDEVRETFVLNTIKALGVTKATWIADYFRMYKKDALKALDTLAKDGRLQTVEVEGWKVPGYYHPDAAKAVNAAAKGKIPQSKTTLLSPFDPIVWHRARGQELFNFTYQIECYTPAPKRIYGYFTLPILYNNALIGRLDPKAHRKEGVFEVKALHLEPGVVVDDAMVAALKQTLRDCADWHKTPKVIVRTATAPGLAEQLSD